MKLTKEKLSLVKKLKTKYGAVVSRKDVIDSIKRTKAGMTSVRWLFNTKSYRAKDRGHYDLNKVEKLAA